MSDTPILNRDNLDQEATGGPVHDAFGRPAAEQTHQRTNEEDTAHDPPTHDPSGPTPPDGPTPFVTMHEPPSGSRTRAWIAGGVAAAVLATGGFFGVEAVASHTKSVASASAGFGPGGGGFGGGPPGAPGGGGVVGTIKSTNGSTLVLTTSSGATETVATTSATTATKATTASLADVQAGDHVVIIGTGTTTVAATSITDSGTVAVTTGPGGGNAPAGIGGGPPGAGAGAAANGGQAGTRTGGPGGGGRFGGNSMGLVSGTVAEVGSGSFTMTETNGTTVKVTTSSSTTVTSLETIKVSDLAAGQAVTVRGTTTNGTVTATLIEEGAVPAGPGGSAAAPAAGQTPA
jgi:hypothetical protein